MNRSNDSLINAYTITDAMCHSPHKREMITDGGQYLQFIHVRAAVFTYAFSGIGSGIYSTVISHGLLHFYNL